MTSPHLALNIFLQPPRALNIAHITSLALKYFYPSIIEYYDSIQHYQIEDKTSS